MEEDGLSSTSSSTTHFPQEISPLPNSTLTPPIHPPTHVPNLLSATEPLGPLKASQSIKTSLQFPQSAPVPLEVPYPFSRSHAAGSECCTMATCVCACARTGSTGTRSDNVRDASRIWANEGYTVPVWLLRVGFGVQAGKVLVGVLRGEGSTRCGSRRQCLGLCGFDCHSQFGYCAWLFGLLRKMWENVFFGQRLSTLTGIIR